jgi:hypothetical protein
MSKSTKHLQKGTKLFGRGTRARKKLLALNLPHTGTKRGTKYFRPPGCIFSDDDSNAIEKGEYVIP